MSDQNSYGSYSTEDDKCPNCGAMKVFSALVCPACGMSYADTAAMKKANASKPDLFKQISENAEQEEKKTAPKPAFDPNASFAKFKDSLNEDSSKAEDEVSEVVEDEIKVIQEETGKQDVELEKPKQRPEYDPVNSGLYGEKRYRVGDDLSKATVMSDKRPEPEADQTVVPTRYGLDSAVVKQKREQSMSDEASKQKMFSNSVSQRYEQYKTEQENSYNQQSFATPYNRGNYDAVPETKPNVWAKIIPLAAVLVLVIVAGIYIAKFVNREKNDKGVGYESGKVIGNEYVNDWAELRIKMDDKMTDAPSLIYSYTKAAYAAQSSSDASLELNLYSLYNGSPAIIVMTYSDGSLFGMDEKEFANSEDLEKLMAEENNSIRVEPDMLLGSHTYKAISAETKYDNDKMMRMYMCYRKIGNKMNIVFLYDVQGVTDLGIIKKYFQTY